MTLRASREEMHISNAVQGQQNRPVSAPLRQPAAAGPHTAAGTGDAAPFTPRASSSFDSPDGRLRVTVARGQRRDRLFVERRMLSPTGRLVTQLSDFGSIEDFLRWCDADPAKYAYPLEFSSLRKRGSQLFDEA